jgi:aspartate racemase
MSRILGVVGGTGPESTIDYYRRFLATWRRRGPEGTYPRLIINSLEGGAVIRGLGEGRFDDVAAILGEAVDQLAAAGAETALLASNASHLTYDRVAARSPIPLIHILDVTRAAAEAGGHRRLGLFGARFVMESTLYPDRFAGSGIEIVVPSEADRAWIGRIYLEELVQGVILDETRDRLVAIASDLRDREGIDALVLGGTELALILTEPSYAGLPILNTAQIHVEAAVDWLLGA